MLVHLLSTILLYCTYSSIELNYIVLYNTLYSICHGIPDVVNSLHSIAEVSSVCDGPTHYDYLDLLGLGHLAQHCAAKRTDIAAVVDTVQLAGIEVEVRHTTIC